MNLLQRKYIELIVLLALCTPLLINYAPVISPDSGLYMAEGMNIAFKGYYSELGIEPDILRPPLFPALLAVFYYLLGPTVANSLIPIKAAGLLAVLLIYYAGERLAGKRAGLVAALLLLACNYIVSYLFGRLLLDGMQATFLSAATLSLALGFESEKKRHFVAAAIGLAVAFLLKESAIWWLPLPAVAFLIIRPYRTLPVFKGLLLLYAGFAILVGWWWLYVYWVDHSIYLVSAGRYIPVNSLYPYLVLLLIVIGAALLFVALATQFLPFKQYTERYTHYALRFTSLWPAMGALLLGAFLYVASTPVTAGMLGKYWNEQTLPLAYADPLFHLFIPAWCYVAYWSLVKRRPLASLALLYLILHLPMLTILARWENQPRNLLTLFIFSILAASILIVHIGRYFYQRANLLAGNYAPVISGAVLLLLLGWGAGRLQQTDVVKSAWVPRVDYETTVSPANRACASWMAPVVPHGANILISSLRDGEFYFLAQGANYNFFTLPIVKSHLQYIEQNHLFTDGSKLFVAYSADSVAGTPKYRFIAEDSLLYELKRHNINYLVYEGTAKSNVGPLFLENYFDNHNAYQLLCRSGDESIRLSIYQVDQSRLQPLGRTYVDPIALEEILAENRSSVIPRSDVQILDSIGANIQVLAAHSQERAAAYLRLGDIYLAHNRASAAFDMYKYAAGLAPDKIGDIPLENTIGAWLGEMHQDPWAAVAVGNLYRARNMPEQAQAAYDLALHTGSADIELYKQLAQIYESLGNTSALLTTYEMLERKLPKNTEVLGRLARLYEANGNIALAGSMYSAIVKYTPGSEAPLWEFARFYERHGQWESATAVYALMLEQWPDRADIHLALGAAYAAQNSFTPALAAYLKSLELAPHTRAAYMELAAAYKAQNRFQEAISVYQIANQAHPEAAWPYVERGRLYLQAVAKDNR